MKEMPEAAVELGGTLVLDGLPFDEGEAVEVIVLSQAAAVRGSDRYSLRGSQCGTPRRRSLLPTVSGRPDSRGRCRRSILVFRRYGRGGL